MKSKLFDLFSGSLILLAIALVTLIVSGVAVGQEKQKYPDFDAMRKLSDESEESREEAKRKAWEDPDYIYAYHKDLSGKIHRTVADGKAAAKKIGKPYMIFSGKDSLTSRAGRLLADEFVDKAVLVYLEKGFGNETDELGSRLLFMGKDGQSYFVKMCDCNGATSAAIDKGMAQQFTDGASTTVTQTTVAARPTAAVKSQSCGAAAPMVLMQQAAPKAVRFQAAPVRVAAPPRTAVVRRGGG